ncbi:Serine/threonine-protein kinase RIO3 isoform X1 [Oopsacas minuta]|uniref:Serine/threonine-protein kinase RIO3 n=1 Tax=Oopsacas minuta TaxID=111878 RepID=A0AAV7KAR1_9METZ|nr:Serine/threonine-protein kinase RIO3 isoform X1 [Oopsacas minuta]
MTSTEPKSKIWGGPQTTHMEPFSLADVMTEQLVDHLQVEDDAKFARFISDDNLTTNTSSENAVTNPDVENSDFMIAQMMQLEFEQERDESIRLYEKSKNADKKITLSYQNYRTTDHLLSEHDFEDQNQDLDSEIRNEKNQGVTPSKGKKKKRSAKIDTTKHDPSICGRKNVSNTQDFPVDFTSGDLYDTKYDFQLNNRVYNELKQFSHKDKKRYAKIKDNEVFATQDLAVDERTRVTLFKLIDNGTFTEVTGIVATGKEAVILHASGGIHGEVSIPKEVAIKIFKTTLIEFKSREKYIKDDYRFKSRLRHSNPRKLIAAWVEKEMHNLKRLEKFQIPCPHVVLHKNNAIIMDFIGSNREAAPQLRNAVLNADQLKSAYEQCLDCMRKMYKEAHLIHADLSEYNLLWHDDILYFIDVSQSIEPSHPNAHFFLHRDCTNIANFFSQKKLPATLNAIELFNFVTDMNVSEEGLDAVLLTLDNTLEKSKMDHPDYQPHTRSFDYLHEFSQRNQIDSESSEWESDCSDGDDEN